MCFFLKFCDSELCQLCCACFLPTWCVYTRTDTEGKQRKARVQNIFKKSEKTQYLMSTLYDPEYGMLEDIRVVSQFSFPHLFIYRVFPCALPALMICTIRLYVITANRQKIDGPPCSLIINLIFLGQFMDIRLSLFMIRHDPLYPIYLPLQEGGAATPPIPWRCWHPSHPL